MSEKRKLQRLMLTWDPRIVKGHAGIIDEAGAVMEALEPHENLQALVIRCYFGKMLPRWICMLKNLTELTLSDCRNLEYIEDEMKDDIGLRALKTLSLERMKNLKGWWRQEIPEESKRPCFAECRKVIIRDCPELKGPLPLLEKAYCLLLDHVDVKLVTELLIANTNRSPLSHLVHLELSGIEGLICFPKGWIRHQIHLQRLEIVGCTDLRGVSRLELGYLVALNTLWLECEIVDEDGDSTETQAGMPWKILQNLQILKFAVWDKQFLEGISYLTSIKILEIGKWNCEEDVELASKMLRNIHTISIGFDHKTCDLRKTGIQKLRFLTKFTIKDCKEMYVNWDTLLSTMRLEELSFDGVENVTDVENTVVNHPNQLNTLRIHSNGEWKWMHEIPWKSLTSLQVLSLHVDYEGEIEEQIPDGIQHLSSLRTLHITEWRSVKSVPTWFPQLTCLGRLSFRDCSEELSSRCQKENGVDWPLIRHIDTIDIIRPRDDLQNESLHTKKEEEAVQRAGWCGLIRR